MDSQEDTQEMTQEGCDNFQELMDMIEKTKPKKAKAAKRPTTLALKKLTKKSKKELLTVPFAVEAEKIQKPLLPVRYVEMINNDLSSELGDEPLPLLPTPIVENPEKFNDDLNSEDENEPLTPYQEHAAKFQKKSAKPALKLIYPKGI